MDEVKSKLHNDKLYNTTRLGKLTRLGEGCLMCLSKVNNDDDVNDDDDNDIPCPSTFTTAAGYQITYALWCKCMKSIIHNRLQVGARSFLAENLHFPPKKLFSFNLTQPMKFLTLCSAIHPRTENFSSYRKIQLKKYYISWKNKYSERTAIWRRGNECWWIINAGFSARVFLRQAGSPTHFQERKRKKK